MVTVWKMVKNRVVHKVVPFLICFGRIVHARVASPTTALSTMCTPCGAISSFKLPKNSMMFSGLHDQGRPRSLTNFLSRPLRDCISEELSMERPRSSEKWRCFWTDPERTRTWNWNEISYSESMLVLYKSNYCDSHAFWVPFCLNNILYSWKYWRELKFGG